MSIAANELKLYRSQTVSDSGGNGGRMSAVEVVSGAMANLFPAVDQADRDAGNTKYRKFFMKVANDADLTLFSPKVFFDRYTLGDDAIYFFPATQIDIQSDLSGSERLYGAGKLNVNAANGATSIAVLMEDQALHAIQDGDTIRISNKTSVTDTGDEEFLVVDGTVTHVSNVITIPLASALQNDYLAADTRVCSVYEPANLVGAIDDLDVTSSAGEVDIAEILPDSIGGIQQTWTLTFTGATAYNIVGDTVGAVGAGSTGGGASPNNASFSKPYFVLPAIAFSGTFQAGDVLVFTTIPAAFAGWAKRIVPIGAATSSSNAATIALKGETAA